MKKYKYTTTDGMWANCYKIKWKGCADQISNYKVKWPCGICKSCLDGEKSREITNKHEYGKMCKGFNNNQCSICSQIKSAVKMIRHVKGQCLKNCPYCNNNDGVWDRFNKSNGQSIQTIKWLYSVMLKPFKSKQR